MDSQPFSASPSPPGQAQPRSGTQRRWTVQLAATVLGLQAAFFVGVMAWAMLRGGWVTEWKLSVLQVSISVAALAAAHYLLIFGPLALLVLASILVIFLRSRAGWVFAMAVQCIVLFLGLEIYFIERGDDVVELPILYLMLLGSILIVVFLNSPEGRLLLVRSLPALHSEPGPEPGHEPEHEHLRGAQP
jgi:hypothetical protein